MKPHFAWILAGIASAACQAPIPSTSPSTAWSTQARQPAPATTHKAFDERFNLRVGAITAAQFDTEASLGVRNTNVGTSIDFEDDLGLANSTESLRIDAFWRFDRRNRIDVGYFDLTRSGSRTTTREIEWGETTFPITSTVSSYLDTQIIPVRYTHSFVAEDDLDFGLGVGVYYMELAAGLRANSLGIGQSFDSPVPLPVVAMHASWEFLPYLQAFGTVQAFYVDLQAIGEIDELRGRIVDATLGLEYELCDNASLGAAVNYFDMDVDTTTTRLALDVSYEYVAVFVFFSLRI